MSLGLTIYEIDLRLPALGRWQRVHVRLNSWVRTLEMPCGLDHSSCKAVGADSCLNTSGIFLGLCNFGLGDVPPVFVVFVHLIA